MYKYSNEKCNINGCQNPHHSLFLCKQHYDEYITDAKILKIQSLIFRLENGTVTFLEGLKVFIYTIIHLLTTIHVYYYEHFPLESLFIYNFNRWKKLSNDKINKLINDFNFKENHSLIYLKNIVDHVDANKEVVEFTTKSLNKIKNISIYLCSLAIYASILIFYKPINQIPNFEIYKMFLLVFILGTTIILSGINFYNSSIQLLQEGLNDNLYNSKRDNLKFIKDSRLIIDKIKGNDEMRYVQMGNIFGSLTIALFILNFKYIIHLSINELIIIIPFLISTAIMIVVFAQLFFKNNYLLTIYKKIMISDFKINLYSLNRDAGLSIIKAFIRNLFIYSFFLIFLFEYILVKYKNVDTFLIVILLIFLSKNFISFLYVYKISNQLKKQFKISKQEELVKLNKSKSKDRFEKHEFVKNLNLNLFFDWKPFLKIVGFSLPFLIDYHY